MGDAADCSKFADQQRCAARHEDMETQPDPNVLLVLRPANGLERYYSAAMQCRPHGARPLLKPPELAAETEDWLTE